MIRKTLPVLALFGCLLVVSSASAQDSDARQATVREGGAPQTHATQAGITHEAIVRNAGHIEENLAVAAAAQQQTRAGRGKTLMIVGGAAFLAGLIIGDDAGNAIAIGGAAVGIYGLYLWAQTQQ